ncbi:putative Ig domain-containing protein [Aliikangiella sp. IMCC44359]|uniref:putative Ig domain-containing protein n=1 Tax=Aliikangiella sp. IMCC44359 TaxID=3459125 RepID=UPI00403AAACF
MIKLKRVITIFLCVQSIFFILPTLSAVPNLGDANCASLLLVSSWTRNNVKIYDGCSGEFIRDLDSQNLIDGPLRILQAPDKDLLVVSEKNSRLIKFDLQTLSTGTVVMGDDPTTSEVENNFITNPVGAVIDDDGTMYAASYTLNSVVKINTETWAIIDEMLEANNPHIKGIDAGMMIHEDGHLYIPGYDSDNIIKLNLANKAVTEVVAPGTGGLNAPRTILFREQEIVVTAERSNAIMVFDINSGVFKQTLVQIAGPTGLMQDGADHFLVNTSDAVFRVTNDASSFEKVVQNGAGNLAGGTFVYRLKKTGLDTDNDGLTNEDEVNVHGTDPENPDTDGDNLTDGDEVNTYGTNPLLKDTDTDGIPDDYEVANSLKPLENDASGDLDKDGLTNLEEYQAGTLANNDDTDGDGEKDGEDSNPLIPNTAPAISGVPETSLLQNDNYQFIPTITYAGDISTVSFSIQNKPDWTAFNGATGELSGIPNNSHVGVSQDITIIATNGYHNVDLPSFSIEVVNINDAPTMVDNIPAQNLIVGENFSLDISAYFNDIDIDDRLVFSAEGLPNGLEISQEGVISGVPSMVETTSVTTTATDKEGVFVSGMLSIKVNKKIEEKSGSGNFAWLLFLLSTLILIKYHYQK